MKVLRRKMNGKNSGIANGVLKKHSGKSGNAVIPDGAASITRRAFYTCKRLLTAPKKKNADNIKAIAIYCPFDEKNRHSLFATDFRMIGMLDTIKYFATVAMLHFWGIVFCIISAETIFGGYVMQFFRFEDLITDKKLIDQTDNRSIMREKARVISAS